MATPSLTLRIVYTACLAGATCVHVATHLRYGVFLNALEGLGYSLLTRVFWSSLTLLDPIAGLLMFIRPRAGLALAVAIIVSDVAHNGWILHHFGRAPDAAFWAQVAFLIFLLATIVTAWRGLRHQSAPRVEERMPNHPTEPTSTAVMPSAGQPARQP
jgi:hypothetical protein